MYLSRIIGLAFIVLLSLNLSGSSVGYDNSRFDFNVEYSQEGNIAKLAWSYDKSNKVAYYICEKSQDGTHFVNFSQVISSREANIEIDEDLSGLVLYYRIKTVLKSGKTLTSQVEKVELVKTEIEVNATFYPNPVIETANIKISNYQNQSVAFAVYNDQGVEVISVDKQKGVDHKLDFKGVESGMYFIKATIGDEVFIEKVDVID